MIHGRSLASSSGNFGSARLQLVEVDIDSRPCGLGRVPFCHPQGWLVNVMRTFGREDYLIHK